MKLTFLGGTKIVTGALYLLETEKRKILVDCGLIQGSYLLEEENYRPWPFNPAEIDYIFITHAHLDHIGRLPKIVNDGFRGKIFSTPPTKDFAYWLLKDSAHILKKEARKLKRVPLYRDSDVNRVFSYWQTLDYHQPLKIDDLKITFFDAGHILGSAFISFLTKKGRLVFSGDLGNWPMPLLRVTEKLPKDTKWVLVESAYGDRIHEDRKEREEILEDIIEEVALKKGVLLIPAFAMERTQEILYYLNDLIENGRVPKIKIFLDSSLAIRLTEVYKKYTSYFSPQALSEIKKGDDLFSFPNLKLVESHRESENILKVPPPKMIIAGSGMMHGGRILHHLINYLPLENTYLLIVGYQVKGSLGRRLLEGAKRVRIYGQSVEVKAKIKAVGGFSAHADQKQLLEWLRPARFSLKKVFVVQGEEKPANTLATKIRDLFALESLVPSKGETFDFSD